MGEREREREVFVGSRKKKKEGKKNEALRKYRSLSACKSCKYYTIAARSFLSQSRMRCC